MQPIRVLIVDDHPIVRQGIQSLLSAFANIQVIGEADSPVTTLARINDQKPDVILLDIRLGAYNGLQVARHIQQTHPECKVIILTTYNEEAHIADALDAGVYAYLLKDVFLL